MIFEEVHFQLKTIDIGLIYIPEQDYIVFLPLFLLYLHFQVALVCNIQRELSSFPITTISQTKSLFKKHIGKSAAGYPGLT